mgnify:CR=1 FL=1|tara:strand:+ start:1700 stop:2380 length:681 start_codon:yes stop_codon:yes gene_type:complete
MIVIENVFNEQQLLQVRQWLQHATWDNGLVTAGQQARGVKKNQQVTAGSKVSNTVEDLLLDVLARHPAFISAALPLKIVTPMINRYLVGETYGLHVDNAIRVPLNSTTRIRTDLSATLFLTDPANYDGGELEIKEQFGSQKLKLNAGDLVLYPSTSLHQVTPVTRGERISVVFWIQSMVRDNEQRSMLYDLDQSVQSLTGTLGHEAKEVMQLSGLYHNLIRKWSDT